MTVRLLVPYGKYPKNTNLTTNPTEEARLLRENLADTNTAAGTEYVAPARTKWQTPVSLKKVGDQDFLFADNRNVTNVGGIASIAGTAGVGNVLTAQLAPGWAASSYQWTRDGVDIAGATSATYTQAAADYGKAISVRVVGASFTATGSVMVPAASGPTTSIPNPALTAYYTAVANRNSEAVRIVGVGDSWMEGRNVSSPANQWTRLIQAQLRSKYPSSGIGTGGGVGYIPIFNANSVAPYTNPWTKTGGAGLVVSFNNGGLGLRCGVFASAAQDKATITVTGTTAIIHFYRGNGTRTAYYKVDGAAAVTFETGGGTGTDNGFQTVNLGASGSHTLEVGLSAGSPCYIAGVAFFDGDESKGFTMYEGGHSGYRTADYINAAGSSAAGLSQRIGLINPHLVIIALGQNDFCVASPNYLTPAQYKANLKTMISQYRAAGVTGSFLLVSPADTTATKDAAQTATLAQFIQAGKEVASEDTGGPGGTTGVAFVSIAETGRIPPTTGSAGGLWADGGHVGDAGQVIVSDIIFQAISS